MLARPDTKARGRFCVKRCGPSHRRLRTASAVLKNFARQPEKTVFNSIGTKRTYRVRSVMSAFGGKAENICSHGAFPVWTHRRHGVAGRLFRPFSLVAPSQSAKL